MQHTVGGLIMGHRLVNSIGCDIGVHRQQTEGDGAGGHWRIGPGAGGECGLHPHPPTPNPQPLYPKIAVPEFSKLFRKLRSTKCAVQPHTGIQRGRAGLHPPGYRDGNRGDHRRRRWAGAVNPSIFPNVAALRARGPAACSLPLLPAAAPHATSGWNSLMQPADCR